MNNMHVGQTPMGGAGGVNPLSPKTADQSAGALVGAETKALETSPRVLSKEIQTLNGLCDKIKGFRNQKINYLGEQDKAWDGMRGQVRSANRELQKIIKGLPNGTLKEKLEALQTKIDKIDKKIADRSNFDEAKSGSGTVKKLLREAVREMEQAQITGTDFRAPTKPGLVSSLKAYLKH